MSTDVTWHTLSESSAATEKLGEQIGRSLQGGEVIELVSDLGGGKTTLVRGIAKGFGSYDKVASPTFTVSKEYRNGKKRIVHYDFYRLTDPGLLRFELAETLEDPDATIIIEWAELLHDILPDTAITISIQRRGDSSRLFSLTVPKSLSYVLTNLR